MDKLDSRKPERNSIKCFDKNCFLKVGRVGEVSSKYSNGQYNVSKCLAFRYILKSIVKELNEKK